MSSIVVTPLGAGQEVGRSCVLASISNRTIMFDCGLHMGFRDERRFPQFDYLKKNGITVDAVAITHFHLDHVGGLVHFTQHVGYSGVVLMTSRDPGDLKAPAPRHAKNSTQQRNGGGN